MKKHWGIVVFLVLAAWVVEIFLISLIVVLCVLPFYIWLQFVRPDIEYTKTQRNQQRIDMESEMRMFAEKATADRVLYQTISENRRNGSSQPNSASEIINDIRRNGGLIIAKPWIDLILGGEKTWEMRSKPYKKTGYIALIGKGTRSVLGIAKIDGYSGKLSLAELKQSEKKHRVPASKYESSDYKWFVAMYLSHIVSFAKPIPYEPRAGAVIWVKLAEQISVLEEIQKRLVSPMPSKATSDTTRYVANVENSKLWLSKLMAKKTVVREAQGKIPMSSDGALYDKDNVIKDGLIHLRKGKYEYRFESYIKSLGALRRDPKLEWKCFKRGRQGWKNIDSWVKF